LTTNKITPIGLSRPKSRIRSRKVFAIYRVIEKENVGTERFERGKGLRNHAEGFAE
jgi:hypothetical protein